MDGSQEVAFTRQPRRPAAQRGFVLLMVLVVLVLAGTVLAGTARLAGREALSAAGAMEELQLRWAVRSVEAVGCTSAEKWLQEDAADARDADAPPSATRRRLVLGGLEVTLITTDEEAKANANVLAARGGVSGLVASLRRLQSECRTAARIELIPATPREGVISSVPRLYQSYAQLFPDARPAELLGGEISARDDYGVASSGHGVAGSIACWGSGRVNLRRASRDVLRQMLAGLATEDQIDKLIRYRADVPGCSVGEAVAHLELDDQDKTRRLEQALTVVSRCHGLWVVVRGTSRSWYRLRVRQEGDAENDSGEWTFEW